MELALPMFNVHPYLSLKNLSKKVCIIHNKIQQIDLWYILEVGHLELNTLFLP